MADSDCRSSADEDFPRRKPKSRGCKRKLPYTETADDLLDFILSGDEFLSVAEDKTAAEPSPKKCKQKCERRGTSRPKPTLNISPGITARGKKSSRSKEKERTNTEQNAGKTNTGKKVKKIGSKPNEKGAQQTPRSNKKRARSRIRRKKILPKLWALSKKKLYLLLPLFLNFL